MGFVRQDYRAMRKGQARPEAIALARLGQLILGIEVGSGNPFCRFHPPPASPSGCELVGRAAQPGGAAFPPPLLPRLRTRRIRR